MMMTRIQQLMSTFVVLALTSATAYAIPVTVSFTNNTFFSANTDGDATDGTVVIPQTFMDGLNTVNYGLKITLKWYDATQLPSLVEDAGQTGLFDDTASGVGVDTNTAGTTGNSQRFNSINSDALVEGMFFEIDSLDPGYSFLGFSNGVHTNDSQPLMTFVTPTPTTFVAHAQVGTGDGTSPTPAYLVSIDGEFQAVPEPSQWAMLVLVGIAFGAKRFGKRFLAA